MYNKRFLLTTDASQYATSAILLQTNQEVKEVIIAYGGRKLSGLEQSYTTTECQCLAVIAGLEEFEPYLWGKQVTF
jgi:hypothetical protein